MTLMSNRGSLLLSGFPPFHFHSFSCSLNFISIIAHSALPLVLLRTLISLSFHILLTSPLISSISFHFPSTSILFSRRFCIPHLPSPLLDPPSLLKSVFVLYFLAIIYSLIKHPLRISFLHLPPTYPLPHFHNFKNKKHSSNCPAAKKKKKGYV